MNEDCGWLLGFGVFIGFAATVIFSGWAGAILDWLRRSGKTKSCNTDNILGKIDYEIVDVEQAFNMSRDYKDGVLHGLRLAKRFIKEEI